MDHDHDHGEAPLLYLKDAIDLVLRERDDGVCCPCCGQYCRVYKRRLNAGMVRALIWLVLASDRKVRSGDDPDGWVKLGAEAPAWLLRAKELATTRHWGMVERRPMDPADDSVRTSGIWRPTARGRSFIFGMSDAPVRVHLFNNTRIDVSSERFFVREALGKKFNYSELMQGV